jgi:hypothetical protein
MHFRIQFLDGSARISFVRSPGGECRCSGSRRGRNPSRLVSPGEGKSPTALSFNPAIIARVRRRSAFDTISEPRIVPSLRASFLQSPRGCTGRHTREKLIGLKSTKTPAISICCSVSPGSYKGNFTTYFDSRLILVMSSLLRRDVIQGARGIRRNPTGSSGRAKAAEGRRVHRWDCRPGTVDRLGEVLRDTTAPPAYPED